jgi:hypothetical protein
MLIVGLDFEIVCEVLEGTEGDNQTMAALRNLEHALEDYEASREPLNGHAPQQMELRP